MPSFDLSALPAAPEWRLIDLRYGGRCQGCFEWVEEGEHAWWLKNEGVRHEYCPPLKEIPAETRRLCASCFQSVPESQLDAATLCTNCR